MNLSVILAHPNKKSFNHAIAVRAVSALEENMHDVAFHDLYEEQFNPLLPAVEFSRDAELPRKIESHCREISKAEGIIIVHPNWWGQPPAVLKGWIDRIIRPGVAYEFIEGDGGEGVPRGLLKAGSAIVFNTSNTETSREVSVFGDPLETIWKNCIFGLCGVEDVYRRTFNIIVTSTKKEREEWLREVAETVKERFPKGGTPE